MIIFAVTRQLEAILQVKWKCSSVCIYGV